MRLFVFFDGQFWRGILEKDETDTFGYTFGAEPKDSDIFDFILKTSQTSAESLPQQNSEIKIPEKFNPKRLKRIAAKEISSFPPSKSLEAVKLRQEQNKKESIIISKEHKEFLKEYKRKLKVQKAKEKRKGR